MTNDTPNPVRETMDSARPIDDVPFQSLDGDQEHHGDTRPEPPANDWDEGGDVSQIDVDWSLVCECGGMDQNDRDNARRLLKWFGDDLCYVQGMGWLTWRGTHWQRDESDLGARLLAQNIVDKIKLEPLFIKLNATQQSLVERAKSYREIPLDERSDTQKDTITRADKALSSLYNKRTKRLNFAISSGNSGKTKAMLEQAASLRATDQDLLDADHSLFNVRNGTLCFARVEDEESPPNDPRYKAEISFGPHDRADMLTKMAEVEYDTEAKCPEFEKFMAKVQPDPEMRRFLQVFQAYSLLIGGNDEQKLAFHYGTGANGKSAFIEIFGRMSGTYRTVVSPETVTGEGQRQGQQASPDIARLFNTRYVTVEELPKNAPLKEDLIKAVSGGTKMTARFLMQNIFEFEPIFTATLSGNTKPSISGSDYGIWRRVLLVLWGVTIPEAERVQPSILAARLDKERAGILNWLIEGIRLYIEEGLNSFIPESVTAFTQDYRNERDNVGVFAETFIIPQEGGEIRAGELYKAYEAWCEVNGVRNASQRSFGDRLTEMGYEKTRGRHYTYINVVLGEVPTKFDPAGSSSGAGHGGANSEPVIP